MRSINNQVHLIGNVGNELELKEVGSGKKVMTVSLATNQSYKNKSGEKVEQTEWHTVKVWGKQAELLAQYGKKGKRLAISGSLRHRNYEDKEGVKKYVTEVVADEVMFLS